MHGNVMISNLHKTLIASLIMITPALSWSINPHDEYYAEDLYTAIEEAKKRPHHYDYSRAKRYNRSTTQSLNIPRLFNTELESASIETVDATNAMATDAPVDDQQGIYDISDEDVTINRFVPLDTSTPISNNPNVQAANITTNVIAR